MYILRVQHAVSDFAAWKRTFDSDPARRQLSGVRRYRIARPVDDPKMALIDLEFDSLDQARGFLATLRTVWGKLEGTLISGPRGEILEKIEAKEYSTV